MEQNRPTPSPADTPSPSALLSSLLSNPDVMAKLSAVMGQASAPFSADQARELSASVPPAIPTDGLSAVLSNPDLMAKLPDVMAMLKSMPTAGNAVVPSPASKGGKSHEDCRNDLLLALKPFLSPERCQAVDTMLRISRLGTVIRQMK